MPEGPAPDRCNDELEGRYANYFNVGHNAFEVIVEFGQFYEGDREARMHTRIITSSAYAKSLLGLLQESMEQYEEAFGPIPREISGTSNLQP